MPDVIGFYGIEGPYGCFSNFYPAEFNFAGQHFTDSEHMIMWQKAMLFGDIEMAERIQRVKEPKDAKRLGRKVSPYDDDIWATKREELVVPGLYAKFSQNPDLRFTLLRTGDVLLAECSPRDTIWGIGLPIWHQDVRFPTHWRGTNLLGSYLVKVRAQLREECLLSSGAEDKISWRDYEAKRVNAYLAGCQLPSIDDCVMQSLEKQIVCRRADIIHDVTVTTGIDKHGVERNINSTLQRLVRNNVIVHSGHDEWRLP